MSDTLTIDKKEQFLANFFNLDFSHDAPFSLEKRDEAKKVLDELKFPNSKTEYWKYTRINKVLNGSYKVAYPENELELDISIPSKNCIVLINGFYYEDLSFTECIEGVRFSSLSSAKQNDPIIKAHFDAIARKDEIFSTMNTAFHQDGAVLHLEKNIQATDPFYIINFYEDQELLAQPRNFIYLEQGSEAKVVLKSIAVNGGNCFTNALTEIFIEANAKLEIDKVQDEESTNYQIATEQVQQARDSYFKINTFTLNGALVRNNLNIDLQGQHTETYLNGLYPLKDKQHVDNHTFVHHRKPNCESHELYKGIMDDQSTGVFNGKVHVHQEAQKTNAYQSNGNIVLTDTATINSKPELEIYADDVKCSHGSTTGQLDEEALFYLRARGLSKESARAVLVNAFAADVIEQISTESVREEIEAHLDQNYKGIR